MVAFTQGGKGYIAYIQSMTLFFVIDHGQWHFLTSLAINFCHWLQSMTNVHKFCVIDWSQWHMAISSKNIGASKMSLTSQWHFLKVHITAGSRWNLSLTSQWHFSTDSLRIVIDRSMTVSKGAHYSRVSENTVIDRSMTLFNRQPQNCHWPVNDSF